MRSVIALPLLGASLVLSPVRSLAQQDERPAGQPPGTASTAEQPPTPPPQGPPPAPPEGTSPSAPDTQATDGQWVYTDAYGWIWVPSGSVATETEVDAVPDVYLYAPAFGWMWFASPWGPGPFFVGSWVHAPYHHYGDYRHYGGYPYNRGPVGPRYVAPRSVVPIAPRPAAPTYVGPRYVGPRPVAPGPVAPRYVAPAPAPRYVAPASPAPRYAAPPVFHSAPVSAPAFSRPMPAPMGGHFGGSPHH